MSDEQQVDLELAHENLSRMKTKIAEASSAVAGFQPATVFYNAELATIRQILVRQGLCTHVSYADLIADNLQEALEVLVDLGVADPGLLDDEMDGTSEDDMI